MKFTEGEKRLSRGKYVKFKIAIRDHEFNVFIRGGRLFQQYLADNIEKEKIELKQS